MKSLLSFALIALGAYASAAPTGSPSQCRGLTFTSLNHASTKGKTFTSNDQVILGWSTSNTEVTNIREVDLYSARNQEFLHTQHRSYPGVSITNGNLSFTLTVPLCLQKDGEYYLGVYSSTPGQDMDCFSQTSNFKLTPDPNGDYTVCS